jgi:hypothetical protein
MIIYPKSFTDCLEDSNFGINSELEQGREPSTSRQKKKKKKKKKKKEEEEEKVEEEEIKR